METKLNVVSEPKQVISSINSVLKDLDMKKLLLIYHFAVGVGAGLMEPKKRQQPKQKEREII